jgi:hypothetical protein
VNALQPSRGAQIGRACGVLFGIPWTLCACVFLALAVGSFSQNSEGGLLPILPVILISLLFIGIGLAMIIAGVLPWIARMRVAKPEISLSTSTLSVGEGFSVYYAQTFKQTSDVQGIKLQLILRERATYRRGTDTTTVTHEETAAEYVFPAKVYESGEQLSFSRSMEIPPDGMHTFRGRRNKILWLLRVKVDIAGWPDYSEDYELFVQPSAGR